MTAFDQFLDHLKSKGFTYELGFLTSTNAPTDTIGFRMATDNQQIDLYIRDEFWDASKSQVKLGESQEIVPGILVSEILR